MILNVIDHRKSFHKWKRVDAVIEPTWHDNKCAGADEAPRYDGEADHDAREDISVAAAIAWASALTYGVTLYLYDVGVHAADAGPLSAVESETRM